MLTEIHNAVVSPPLVSCVQTTFRRFKCVERSINCFLRQNFEYPAELIIFNTDVENKLILDYFHSFPRNDNRMIKIFNNDIDSVTGEKYTNVGAIRRDALRLARGQYFVTWDDDDIFLPHFLQQGIDKIIGTGMPSFKPEKSFFFCNDKLDLVENTMEASVISDINLIRKYGFNLSTATEGLAWYTQMRDNKELNEHDPYFVPSYCFNWNDGAEMSAAHKQSGDPDNPDNFNNHKAASTDIINRPFEVWDDKRFADMIYPYAQFLSKEIITDPLLQRMYLKYIFLGWRELWKK